MTEETENLKKPLTNGHKKENVKGSLKINGFKDKIGCSTDFSCPDVDNVDFSSAMLSNMDLDSIKVRERKEEDAMSKDFTISLLKVESKA